MGWIGVDLDATLAHYDGWMDGQIGDPIPVMVNRVRAWLSDGKEVRIFTARVAGSMLTNDEGTQDNTQFVQDQEKKIQGWCIKHIGCQLPITATKDFAMIELWDDRCVQVVPNTGEMVKS